jgi:hypothetical protein
MMSNSSSNNSGCLNLVGMIGAAIITTLGVVGAAFITNVDKFAPKTVIASSTATPPASIINNKSPVEVQTPSPAVIITPSPSPVVVITPSPAVVIVDEAKILKEQLIGEWNASESSCPNSRSLKVDRSITYFKNGTIVENAEMRDVRYYPNLFSVGKFVLKTRLEIV